MTAIEYIKTSEYLIELIEPIVEKYALQGINERLADLYLAFDDNDWHRWVEVVLSLAIKEDLVKRGLRLDISYLPGRSKWRVDIVPQGPNETAVRAECGTECETLLLAFRNYLEVNSVEN